MLWYFTPGARFARIITGKIGDSGASESIALATVKHLRIFEEFRVVRGQAVAGAMAICGNLDYLSSEPAGVSRWRIRCRRCGVPIVMTREPIGWDERTAC